MKTKTILCLTATLVCATKLGFAAEVSLGSAPPVVVKTVPVAGATEVDPGLAEIKVTYSKAMQDGSWSWSTWGEGSYPETTGEPKYLKDGRTCVLPVNLQPNRFYAIWLNSEKFKNFKDGGGRPAVPYLLTFYTAHAASGTKDTVATREYIEKAYVYDVQAGDTMSAIAKAYRAKGTEVTVEDILKVNPGLDPKALKVGQKIFIPAQSTRSLPSAANAPRHAAIASDANLNDDQRAILGWTDRQFRSFFDERTFDGWSEKERTELETRLIDSLKGPRSREYYQAISTLAALHSAKALPALRELAYDRRDKDNRDRWMAIRALGMIGEQNDVPELIQLVYHGNVNTRWWAQISLVRLTGQNFAKDWNAWGKWWNDQNGQPPFKPEIIRWWSGQAEPEKLAESLDESDRKFFEKLNPK